MAVWSFGCAVLRKMGRITLVAGTVSTLFAAPIRAQEQSESGDAAQAQCFPTDQLQCNCDKVGVAPERKKPNLVFPCLPPEVNRAVINQTDPFANKVFSALNWPVSTDRGVADFTAKPQSVAKLGDYVTVWDTWPSKQAFFLDHAADPGPWTDAKVPMPAACAGLDIEAEKARFSWANVPDGAPVRVLNDFINTDADLLVDESGEPIRYEVLLNKRAYDYLYENRLWQTAARDALLAKDGAIQFPMSDWSKGVGAPMILKAGWKIMDRSKDDPAHFHKSWALITPVMANGQPQSNRCELRPVALLALHVVSKSSLFKDWLWMTFEHIAVAPTWEQLARAENGVGPDVTNAFEKPNSESGEKIVEGPSDWLFYDAVPDRCDNPNECPAFAGLNVPKKFRDLAPIALLPTRLIAVQPRGYYFPERWKDTSRAPEPGFGQAAAQDYDDMEQGMRVGFADTALRFYRLKGVQWKDPEGAQSNRPEILANTVLEAFSQNTSSCLSCHGEAGRPKGATNGHPFDYIFALGQSGTETTVHNQTPP